MAVKVTDLAENKRLVRQCKREALTLRALRGHPNVINYLSMRLNDKLQVKDLSNSFETLKFFSSNYLWTMSTAENSLIR